MKEFLSFLLFVLIFYLIFCILQIVSEINSKVDFQTTSILKTIDDQFNKGFDCSIFSNNK